jgi:hypothetical protein
MNFAGWVAIPRSILHLPVSGHLTTTEFAALLQLWLLADAATGSGYINAAALRTYMPDISYPAAKRVLTSLEKKRCIYRKITPRSKLLYHYWLHGYQISRGVHSLLQTDISQVFEANDTSKIAYSKSVPEIEPDTEPQGVPDGVPDTEPQGVPDGVLNNNTDKDTDLNTNTDPKTYAYAPEKIKIEAHHPVDAHQHFAAGIAETAGTVPQVAARESRIGIGLRYSEASGFTDDITGEPVPPDEVNLRISHLGITYRYDRFHNTKTGSTIPTQEAIRRITGVAIGERRAA